MLYGSGSTPKNLNPEFLIQLLLFINLIVNQNAKTSSIVKTTFNTFDNDLKFCFKGLDFLNNSHRKEVFLTRPEFMCVKSNLRSFLNTSVIHYAAKTMSQKNISLLFAQIRF